MTITIPETDPDAAPDKKELVHLVCCNPDEALCGMDVTGFKWVGAEEEITCPMCSLMEGKPCRYER